MSEISTIHAFCSKLIHSYFFLADVDSAFEIIASDDADGKELKSEAMEEVFTESYESGDEDFLYLLSIYHTGKKDDTLKALILKCYEELRNRADYREFLLAMREEREVFDDACADLMRGVHREAEHILGEMEDAEGGLFSRQNVKSEKVLLQVAPAKEVVQDILRTNDYFEFCERICKASVKFETAEKKKGMDEETLALAQKFYAARDKLKALLGDKNHKNVASREEERARVNGAQKVTKCLAKFILLFDEKYSELKSERAKLDYDDLEHITLRLLENESVQKEVRGKYDYVYVDEYQDISPVQEKILSYIGGENVFLVGDVKQSIYAFRGGRARYFTEKCDRFATEGYMLQLTSNFRSSSAILDGVNRVFVQAMTRETSDVNYAAAPMRGGSAYGEHEGYVRVHYLKEEESEEVTRGVYSVPEERKKAEEEADASEESKEIFSIIQEALGSEYYSIEEGKMKPVTYGDIAVIARDNKGLMGELIAYLAQNGIPVSTAAKIDLCAFSEIKQLTDILSLIDNREQDIPLCSALLSDMGGVSNDDLVKIRLRYENNKKPFRECVRMYADQFEDDLAQKLKVFYDRLGKYVALSVTLTAGELTERLIADCGQEAKWMAMEGGGKRIAHVRAFVANMGEKNVHEFLQYLKELDNSLLVADSGGENAVKVMTMHASKGLEFPVVILARMDKLFNRQDARENFLYSDRYGIATNYYDEQKKLYYRTLLFKAILAGNREEQLKEELNLLYVAMTRAKYGLHIVMKEKKDEKSDPFYANCFADLLPASLFEEGEEIERAPFAKRQILIPPADGALEKKISSCMSVPYPRAADITLPVKSSASGLMQEQDEFFAPYDLLPKEGSSDDLQEVGTAYHAFLQFACLSADGAEELTRMVKTGVLPEAQSRLLSPEKCRQILGMPVFRRLAEAQLYREQPFLVSLPAREMLETDSDRKVLFQGAIDLLAVGKEGVEIVDYKYSSRAAAGIREHYAVQIKLYKKAVASIMHIRENAIRTTIVNIRSGEEIPV
jgi:ATP-dependent helicase/nuclease subunit A